MLLAVAFTFHLTLAPGIPPDFATSLEGGHQRRLQLQSCGYASSGGDLDSRLAGYAPGELGFTVKQNEPGAAPWLGVECYAMGAENGNLVVAQRTGIEFQRAMIGMVAKQPGATSHFDYPCGPEDLPNGAQNEWALRSLPRGSDVGGAALALICISHAWHGRDHPDPHGDNLLAFVEAVRKQQAHGWKNQQLPTRFAVFYDYCSMPQKRGWAGRTAAEDRAFRRALSQMQVMYAHKKTLVYMLTVNPKWTVTPTWDCKEYTERGWPNFEQRVSMLLKMQSSRAWANVVNVGNPNAKQLVPLTPEGFAALLETLHFTNGADRGPVAELYRKTIENALSQTQELRFVKQGWGDKEIAELVGVLPLCTELRRLALDDNDEITAKGAKTLADALAERGAAPKLTHLGVEARSSMGLRTNFASSKELRAVCESRRIVIIPFAGIRNDMVRLKSNSKRLAKERSSSTRMKWRSTGRMVMTGRMVTATSPAVVMPMKQ